MCAQHKKQKVPLHMHASIQTNGDCLWVCVCFTERAARSPLHCNMTHTHRLCHIAVARMCLLHPHEQIQNSAASESIRTRYDSHSWNKKIKKNNNQNITQIGINAM